VAGDQLWSNGLHPAFFLSLSNDQIMGVFVYAVTAANVVRLRHLQKRLQRSLLFVYARIYPISIKILPRFSIGRYNPSSYSRKCLADESAGMR